MIIPIEIKALDDFRIWVRFDDGVQGEVSLKHLVGKGVFNIWNDYEAFKKVYINPESHSIAWSVDIDICPDTLYLKIVNKSPEEFFALNKSRAIHARNI